MLTVCSPHDALADLNDGATILVSGFGGAGVPASLLFALFDVGRTGLTMVCNNAGSLNDGLARLFRAGRIRKLICAYPRRVGGTEFDRVYHDNEVALELVPQGTLCERIRAGGVGLGPFYTLVGADTELGLGKEVREIGGRTHVLEWPIVADFAFVRAEIADHCGNLTYRRTARNYGPIMAMTPGCTVAEVARMLPDGDYHDPECVVTPGIFVQRLVVDSAPA